MEMYKQLPPDTYPKTLLIDHTFSDEKLLSLLTSSTIKFPIAVKPDAGMMGFMFRTLHSNEELLNYHHKMPCAYLIQEFINLPLEVSVFYYRFPDSSSGTITGFIKKEFLQVEGDGVSKLRQLIENYPRANFRQHEMLAKHHEKLHIILKAGEKYILSHALNLSRGGKLVSLEQEKDDKLLALFDKISLYTKHFYYGRYDIKCASTDLLKNGEQFSILEYNGCGAEPHHIYGNHFTLLQAWSIVLKHWKVLFKISIINHRKGYTYWPYQKGKNYLKDAKVHFKVLKKLDLETQV